MANMIKINSLTYTPKENLEWFTRAMFGGRLVANGYLNVLTGIKGDELFNQIDLENKILQPDGLDCAWTPNQVLKLSEKRASVKTYKINLEQCINELEQKRLLYSLGPGATNNALPDDLEAAALELIAIGLSKEIEEMVIGGNSTLDPNSINGLATQLLASTTAIKVVGAVLTAANILAKVAEVYNALPEDVLQAEETQTLYIYLSYAARRLLRTALTTVQNTSLAEVWSIDEADKRNPRIYYLGTEIVPVLGIGRNTIIGIAKNNAYLLTDLESDLESIRMGQFPAPMDNKVFFDGRLRLGASVPFEDEAVISDPSISVASGGYDPTGGLSVSSTGLVFPMAGAAKTLKIVVNTTIVPTLNIAGAVGFTVSALGSAVTSGGKDTYTITVTAAASGGNVHPRVGQLVIALPDSDRSVTVMLDQRNENVPVVTP